MTTSQALKGNACAGTYALETNGNNWPQSIKLIRHRLDPREKGCA